jgi:predicted kinase
MEAVIFTGIQGSGKSTFYRDTFFRTHVRINLDMLKTRNRERILIEACLKAGQPFVVDNTNPTVESRKKYIDMAKASGFRVTGYYFRSGIREAMARNEKRTGKEQVPPAGIRRTHASLQLPGLEEGFDRLYYVRIDEKNNFVVEEWNDEIR